MKEPSEMKVKLPLFSVAILIALITAAEPASAQWSLGGSYEIRNESPQNGFGIRLERELLPSAPIARLALRGHFSYFNEENYISADEINYGGITNYDYGLSAVGGVDVGLVSPYLGLGLGASTIELDYLDNPTDSESNLYWNGFVGARVSPLPYIQPFVEYRLQATQEYEDLVGDVDTSNGRLIFGLYLNF